MGCLPASNEADSAEVGIADAFGYSEQVLIYSWVKPPRTGSGGLPVRVMSWWRPILGRSACPRDKVLHHEEKYSSASLRTETAPRGRGATQAQADAIHEYALMAFRQLVGPTCARIDFFLTEEGRFCSTRSTPSRA